MAKIFVAICARIFLKIICDKFFRHYMYSKIVLVTKLFITKYDLINQSVFSDEIFSSLNGVFSEENIKVKKKKKSNQIFSDEIFCHKDF